MLSDVPLSVCTWFVHLSFWYSSCFEALFLCCHDRVSLPFRDDEAYCSLEHLLLSRASPRWLLDSSSKSTHLLFAWASSSSEGGSSSYPSDIPFGLEFFLSSVECLYYCSSLLFDSIPFRCPGWTSSWPCCGRIIFPYIPTFPTHVED